MFIVANLWLPILVSAVLVFVLSAASHMLLPWRRNEWAAVGEFEALQAALRGLKPGQYVFPASPDPQQRMSREWMERWAKGPSGWLTVAPPGAIHMPRNLGLSFLVFLGVAVVDAYVTCRALGLGAHYRPVFRIAGTVAAMSFGVAPIFSSIWYHRPWRAYAADAVDAVVFGLAMAGVFGWLWPR